MRSSSGKPRGRRNRKRKTGFSYEHLEDRRLLAAIVSFDGGTGTLSVELPEDNDAAVIDISNGNVSVNGSEDVNSAAPGTQSVVFTAVRRMFIEGDNTQTGQQVVFRGDYTNANGARVQTITAANVRAAGIFGMYDLANDLSISLNGNGGLLGDQGTGKISVGGISTFELGNSNLFLNNSGNDFVGTVNIINGGANRFAVLSDANDIQFENVTTSGDFVVSAGGNITDIAGSSIDVDGEAQFTGASVVLGDSTSDTVHLSRFFSTTIGLTELNSDSAVILGDIIAEDLTIRTPQGIFDGRTTNIKVTSVATFEGETRIRIGDNGRDTFNAGSLNFNSSGYVSIWEDSGTQITGSNTASSLDLIADGDISDDATSQINVVYVSGFEGDNVVLGDEATDVFNSGAIYFYTPGEFSINEDSGIHIIETKNQAQQLSLTATTTITDDEDAVLTVENLATFTAISVNLGDSEADVFNAGSIQFGTSGQFKLTEDSSTNIIGSNSASSALIESADTITNIYVGSGGEGTNLDVENVASFTGLSIFLGQQENDNLNFGSLHLSSPGVATVTEDSSTHFTLDSLVNELNMDSAGEITDALTASVNVAGVANLSGTWIVMGETTTDEFNAQSISVNSIGNVGITEDSALNLEGVSRANAMTLVANGTLTDSLTADTRVTTLFDVTGTLINLGSESTDFLSSAELRFNSTGNTNITANTNVLLSGTSFAGDQLILTSVGNLNDATEADTRVQNRATLTGVDVIIGELPSDCFDILNGGAANLFVNASGVENVVVGC